MIFRKKKSTTPLFFHNTLTNSREEFSPINAPTVLMYSCGPTVYDHVHIGNLRSFVMADLVKRALRAHGYQIQHTINLTDFGHLSDDGDAGEDKMTLALLRAEKSISMESMAEIALLYSNSFKSDMDALGNTAPTTYAPASNYIVKEVALVKTLVEKGYTYETSDGVYFDIAKFPHYGKLGNIDINGQKSGARVEINSEKRHPADFAVWKKASLGWESPWGTGFPGWHIECTAMAFATLGKQIDIHTGGIDLIPTHHNGEIAQAECATKKSPFVRYWMHNEFIRIDNTKISKSLGNSIRLEQLRERGYQPLVYRYWLLGGQYRAPMNFTFEALDGAKQAWFRLRRHMYEEWGAEKGGQVSDSHWTEFLCAISDDLDTPKALAILWSVVNNKKLSSKDKVATIRKMDTLLGIGLSDTTENAMRSLGVVAVETLSFKVQTLITEREQARKEKNWEHADIVRRAINMEGYLVEDTSDGPRVTEV